MACTEPVDAELVDEAVSGRPQMFQDLDRPAVDTKLLDEAVSVCLDIDTICQRRRVDPDLLDEAVSGSTTRPNRL